MPRAFVLSMSYHRAANAPAKGKAMQKIVVWDVPTRLFHWLTVILVIAAYVTWRLNWMFWHVYAGIAVLALVDFRLLWGFFGSETAQFVRFLTGPRVALRQLAHLFRREPDRWIGHNPAGGWMVMFLLALLLGEALTGIYVDNDVADVGPLTAFTPAVVADFITTLHAVLWQVLLAAIVLHVFAVTVYWAAKRQNLLLPMITGCKVIPPGVRQPAQAGALRALASLGCGTLVAAALAHLL
jgi:cytochrome b